MWLSKLLFPGRNAFETREQVQEIFNDLRAQVPLLYATAIVNLIGMQVAVGHGKLALTSPVIALCALLVWRAAYWGFAQTPADSFARARAELVQVALFTVVLCTGFSIWAQLLITQHPALTLHIVFFNVLAALGAAYGLSSLQRVAMIPLAVMGLPLALRLLLMGGSLSKAMGLSLMLAILLFMRLLHSHSQTLLNLISSRMATAREHNRAISAEVAALKRADEDGLTGIANRTRLIREIERSMIQGPSTGGGSVVAICDLDGFKRANDVFGHAAGDAVLKAFSERLAETFEGRALVARMGGDEFAVFWRNGLSREEIHAAGTLICDLARQPVPWMGKRLTVGTSCGFTEAGPHSGSVEEFLRQADTALYMAKSSGRGSWQFYDDDAFNIDKRRAKLEVLLLSEDVFSELRVDFQPICWTQTENRHHIFGYEALARWNNVDLGDVSPNEFIEIAESIGNIESINKAIFESALYDFKDCNDGERLSFNLSAAQISRQGAADHLLAIMEKCGVSAHKVLFEVKETAVLADLEIARRELSALQRAGCLVALDDFGAGSASVAYLRDLEFDIVKLDGALTKNIQHCTKSRELLLGIVNLCHAAGALCVAEHIETEEQLTLVRAMGCDMVQGYHLSRPINARELRKLWVRRSIGP